MAGQHGQLENRTQLKRIGQLEAQLAVVDIVLHKATDEIVSVDISRQTSDPADRIQYSDSIQRLQRCLTQNSQIVMIQIL